MLGWLVVGVPLAYFAFQARRGIARLFVVALLHSVYRLRAFGREHVPRDGGALLVPNHVSMIDGLWVGAVLPRLVYFLMHRDFVKTPVLGPFTLMMGTIPVATGDSAEAKAESLRRAGARCASGDLVCIFAEGVITRSGSLMPFMKGLETIARSGNVPIVPVALDRVWGSLFSFSGGRFVWKWPRRLPYPIDVVFGRPLPPDTPAWRVRDAVAELLAARRQAAAAEVRPLGYRFVRAARKSARHPAVVEPGGRVTRHQDLLADLLALRSGWQRARAAWGGLPGARVATLAAPGRAGCLVHALLALERELALPLDAAASEADLVEYARRVRAECLVAERATLAARPELARAFGPRAVALEDLLAGTDGSDRSFAALLARLPGPLLARLVDPERGGTEALAAFRARDGVVVLSQANVIANVTALAQTFDFGPDERVLATAPLDDALGHLASLWLPLVTGAAIVVPAGLDGPALAEACRRERVTVLPLAPEHVAALLQHAAPADLASVRLAFCDGARVGPEVLARWQERFGKPLYAGWGLPELAPVATLSLYDIDSGRWHHVGSKPGAVGRAIAGVALRIVDERGHPCPAGERGRLRVRGPGVMQGYLDDEPATRRRIEDGWFDTGLEATVDRDGFLFFGPLPA